MTDHNGTSISVTSATNHLSGKTYDEAGNVIVSNGESFGWDAVGMMRLRTKPLPSHHILPDSTRPEWDFLYTADDERIATVQPYFGGRFTTTLMHTTWTLRGLSNELLRTYTDDLLGYDTAGNQVHQWLPPTDQIWRGTALLASDTPDGTGQRHHGLDHLGSPRVITNSSGTLIGNQDFSPFGMGGTTNGGVLQFTGQERDSTPVMSLYDHARYYDPNGGRFLSVDPVLSKTTLRAPQLWNRYAYVRNNPMHFTDPSGLYLCNGSAEECRAFDIALLRIKMAAFELARQGLPGVSLLKSIFAFYGQIDNDNGVLVEVTKLNVAAQTFTKDGITTTQIDRGYLMSRSRSGDPYKTIGLAVTVAHEGDLGITEHLNGAFRTRADVKWAEVHAYRTEGFISEAYGIDNEHGVWTTTHRRLYPDSHGWNLEAIEYWAEQSTRYALGEGSQ